MPQGAFIPTMSLKKKRYNDSSGSNKHSITKGIKMDFISNQDNLYYHNLTNFLGMGIIKTKMSYYVNLEKHPILTKTQVKKLYLLKISSSFFLKGTLFLVRKARNLMFW